MRLITNLKHIEYTECSAILHIWFSLMFCISLLACTCIWSRTRSKFTGWITNWYTFIGWINGQRITRTTFLFMGLNWLNSVFVPGFWYWSFVDASSEVRATATANKCYNFIVWNYNIFPFIFPETKIWQLLLFLAKRKRNANR